MFICWNLDDIIFPSLSNKFKVIFPGISLPLFSGPFLRNLWWGSKNKVGTSPQKFSVFWGFSDSISCIFGDTYRWIYLSRVWFFCKNITFLWTWLFCWYLYSIGALTGGRRRGLGCSNILIVQFEITNLYTTLFLPKQPVICFYKTIYKICLNVVRQQPWSERLMKNKKPMFM